MLRKAHPAPIPGNSHGQVVGHIITKTLLPMNKQPASRLLGLIFLFLIVAITPSRAQGLFSGGSEQASPSGGRPESSDVGFFELLESGGEAFLDTFRKNESHELVDHPKWNSRKSPRATVMTFLEAMNHVVLGREGAWPRAEATFDTKSIKRGFERVK